MPRPQLYESGDAAIKAARVIEAAPDVSEVSMNADSVTAPRGLLETDRIALEEVCTSSNLVEDKTPRRGGRVLRCADRVVS